MTSSSPASARYLSFRQMHERYGGGRDPKVFRTWLWRQVRAGRWPPPTRLGPNTVGWNEVEIEAHVAALPRATVLPPDGPEVA